MADASVRRQASQPEKAMFQAVHEPRVPSNIGGRLFVESSPAQPTDGVNRMSIRTVSGGQASAKAAPARAAMVTGEGRTLLTKRPAKQKRYEGRLYTVIR